MSARTLAGLLLSVGLLSGCTLAYEGRTTAVVTGSRGLTKPRISYSQVERLLDGIARDLLAAGFKPSPYMHPENPAHPYTHYEGVTGERFYGATYELNESLSCSVQFNRTRVHVTFGELATPSGSHIYSASLDQLQASCALAKRIADYLRANLPSYYRVDVTYSTPPA